MNASASLPRRDWSRPSLGDLLWAVRLIAVAAPLPCLASLVMALAGGMVPAAVAWAIGTLVRSVEIGYPATSPWAAVCVLGATVLIGELVTAVEPLVNTVLAERYTSRIQADTIRSVNSLTTIDCFDDPVLAQRFEVARWVSSEPTTLVNALWHLVRWAMTAASTGFVAAAIVWWTPLAILLLYLVITALRWQQLGLQSDAQLERVTARVQSTYCYRLGVTLPAAKELRTLGIQQWLRERQSSLWHTASEPVLAEARRGLRRDAIIEASRGIGLAACLTYVASTAVLRLTSRRRSSPSSVCSSPPAAWRRSS
jgi:ABC-type multidrug transport system fused ATPase/permease subunit